MFGSWQFKKVLLIRFLGYLFIQVGILTTLLVVEPVFIEELKYQTSQILHRQYSLPKVITSANRNGEGVVDQATTATNQSFGDLVVGDSNILTPVSTDFGIVIEKIGANAKVVADVDPNDERSYVNALGKGVAHTKGTTYPGQIGNIFLFSHSADAPWNTVRYNAIFYLLRKMENGDRIIMFYKGRRYDYIVYDKAIAAPSDTHFLTDSYDQSVLTLQTCDPPGMLSNRLIVRAKLASS